MKKSIVLMLLGVLLTAIVVSKNTRGEHYYNFFQIYEDMVPGVMDGSKFTGQYYTDSIGGPYPMGKVNAMANKGK